MNSNHWFVSFTCWRGFRLLGGRRQPLVRSGRRSCVFFSKQLIVQDLKYASSSSCFTGRTGNSSGVQLNTAASVKVQKGKLEHQKAFHQFNLFMLLPA